MMNLMNDSPINDTFPVGGNFGTGVIDGDMYANTNSSLAEEEQDVRTNLRERYLRAMTALVGMKCEFWMHEHTAVDGVFKGCDLHGNHILVSRLQTHLGIIPQAILRTNDIITFSVKNIVMD